MDNYYILYYSIGALNVLFLFIFGAYSVYEKKVIPAVKVWSMSIIFASYWYFSLELNELFLPINIIIYFLFLLLFFLPIGKSDDIKVLAERDNAEKVDERDTMFARSGLREGTKCFDEYYKRRKELKIIDDNIRSMPKLLEKGGKFFEEEKSKFVKSLFKIEEKRINEVHGPVSNNRIELTPEQATELIKKKALELGASEVGIAELNQNYVYSHQARGTEEWGTEINNQHSYAVAFTVEMNYYKVNEAPKIDTTEETAIRYINAQKISIALAEYIRELGFDARAHISGSNYQIMLPPVAYDAGLGELGRMNYLISKKHGARVRLGAVTTELPMSIDKPINIGVQDFCEKCKKCAVNCPSNSITQNGKVEIRAVKKWEINIEHCYKYWRYLGTDCAMCMKVCPFSHPNNWVHNTIRFGIKQSSFARTFSLWADDFIYGKKIKV